jgi:hypothetical protein
VLHLRQQPLAQAHHASQIFRYDKRQAFVDAAIDQFRDLPILERLYLSEEILGSLRLSARKHVQQDGPARCRFPCGVRPDAVVS